MEATIDLADLTDLEREFERMCEGAQHEDGYHGHIPGTKAAYKLQCKGCGWYIQLCTGRIGWMRTFERGLKCNGCKKGFYLWEFLVTPLPEL